MSYRKISIIALVVVVLFAGTASRVGADDLVRRSKMIHLLNQTRRAHSLAPFRSNGSLSHSAWLHSKRMIAVGYLFHTRDLYRAVRAYNPRMWGENVGRAGGLKRIRSLWMASPSHRHNILQPGFRRVGVGVARAGGSLWVTTIFYGG